MARQFDAISELNASKETWKIRVRVLRRWKVPRHEKKNQFKEICMVLIDDKVSIVYIFPIVSITLIFLHVKELH